MKFTLKIKKNSTFRYVLNKGKFKAGKYVSIHILNNLKNTNINCFGVCISKKNGKSVQRNKLKRWAREVYKDQEEYLKKGNNVVILYKKSTTIDKVDYHLLRDDIISCFEGLDMYEKNN